MGPADGTGANRSDLAREPLAAALSWERDDAPPKNGRGVICKAGDASVGC